MNTLLQNAREKILRQIECHLKNYCYAGNLLEAARYAVSGKCLRPLIVLLTAEALGASSEKALDAACAIEFLHSYSLIHDDLPSMDNDDFRRGKPTVHKAFGEATAILTGDFLLTLSFEVLCNSSHLNDAEKCSLIRILSSKASGKGMIAGQILDLVSEGKKISPKELYSIHYHKTAILFIAAFEFGTVLASVPAKERKIIVEFGKRIGMAYQIADDLQDSLVTSAKNSDFIKNKPTAVTVLGKDKAHRTLNSLYHFALAKLALLPKPAPTLKDFSTFLLKDFL